MPQEIATILVQILPLVLIFVADSTKAMIARWAVRSLEDTPADAQNDLI